MQAQTKLQPIDLLRIYGNIDFEWYLQNDVLMWQGSLMRLIHPHGSLTTGSSFCHLLNPENFQRRMTAIFDAKDKTNRYTVCYYMTLPNHEQTCVIEEGDIIYGHDQHIYKLEGVIRFVEDEPHKQQPSLSGYDLLTGFPQRELLYENLEVLLMKSLETKVPGAYMVASVDHLSHLNLLHGPHVVQEIIKHVAEKLKATIRFSDTIARLSSTCLGIILQECDPWGVIQASQRLTQTIENFKIKTSIGQLSVRISCGGIVFPHEHLTADKVMAQAENCLFDAQSIKGMGISWTPYQDVEPMIQNKTAKPGRQRVKDKDEIKIA